MEKFSTNFLGGVNYETEQERIRKQERQLLNLDQLLQAAAYSPLKPPQKTQQQQYSNNCNFNNNNTNYTSQSQSSAILKGIDRALTWGLNYAIIAQIIRLVSSAETGERKAIFIAFGIITFASTLIETINGRSSILPFLAAILLLLNSNSEALHSIKNDATK